MNGTALICGASEGIGEAFARRLATRGMSRVLVTRCPEPLEALAGSLPAEHRIDGHTVTVDLASPDLFDTLEPVLTDDLDTLVYNAALEGLGRGPVVVPGAMNEVVRFAASRLRPRRAAVRRLSHATRRLYEDRKPGGEGS